MAQQADNKDDFSGLMARALSAVLHAGLVAGMLHLVPASGGTGPDEGMAVELVALADEAPAPEEPKPEPAKVKAEEPAPPKPKPAPIPRAPRKPAAAPAVKETRENASSPADQGPPMEADRPQMPATEPPTNRAESAENASAATGPAPQAKGSDLQDYSAMVWARILRFKPERARFPGTVGLRFAIAADGSLASIEIAAPSGVPALDQLAIEVLRRAAPFAAPPAGADSPMIFTIPFHFR